MSPARTALVLLVALAASPAVLLAQREVDERRGVSSDARIEISNIAGSIRVEGWAQNEVHVTGTLGRGIERLDIEGDANAMRIEVVYPRQGRNVGGADLVVRVPERSDVEVSCVSAGIAATGLSAAVQLNSVSGGIEALGSFVDLEAASVSGAVVARVDGALRKAELESVSGAVDVAATPGPDARISAKSVSGSVVVRLPASASARVDLSTFSGSLKNSLTQDRPARSMGPGRSLDVRLGGGGARIEAESFSGSVSLRPLDGGFFD